jgi:hypothetical protein
LYFVRLRDEEFVSLCVFRAPLQSNSQYFVEKSITLTIIIQFLNFQSFWLVFYKRSASQHHLAALRYRACNFVSSPSKSDHWPQNATSTFSFLRIIYRNTSIFIPVSNFFGFVSRASQSIFFVNRDIYIKIL